ncbi:hypothetical protein Tsubulata_043514 [Turnera subulata]|uniref:Uncharacterized protein n=1 Tax=Turnera subulata TaxID=218843 RepID=A0A9Q0F7S8_9ROSI|nr:hypothetical protein Tsubulata_043496 [Turnera subulata]KAJ4845296.1 hypothetical protein Tsubulata_043514 [Turnera subulata]
MAPAANKKSRSLWDAFTCYYCTCFRPLSSDESQIENRGDRCRPVIESPAAPGADHDPPHPPVKSIVIYCNRT